VRRVEPVPLAVVILACPGNPEPADVKVSCPVGNETFDGDETTEDAPS
jgi:hypothetical protein